MAYHRWRRASRRRSSFHWRVLLWPWRLLADVRLHRFLLKKTQRKKVWLPIYDTVAWRRWPEWGERGCRRFCVVAYKVSSDRVQVFCVSGGAAGDLEQLLHAPLQQPVNQGLQQRQLRGREKKKKIIIKFQRWQLLFARPQNLTEVSGWELTLMP